MHTSRRENRAIRRAMSWQRRARGPRRKKSDDEEAPEEKKLREDRRSSPLCAKLGVGCLVVCGLFTAVHLLLFRGQAITASAPIPDELRFVVMMNTFGEARKDWLQSSVDHYVACPVVAHVYVTHAGPGDNPLDANPRVSWLHREDTSLNVRFEPVEEAALDATFVVDDDVLVHCDDLLTGAETFHLQPDTIVGFCPRLHTRTLDAERPWRYNGWWRVGWDQQYSIVLTKAAFLHRKYLRSYSTAMDGAMVKAKEHVRQHKNCEDLAMQFLVTRESGRPPVYVRGRLADKGVFRGVSTKSNQMLKGGMKHFNDRYGSEEEGNASRMSRRRRQCQSHEQNEVSRSRSNGSLMEACISPLGPIVSTSWSSTSARIRSRRITSWLARRRDSRSISRPIGWSTSRQICLQDRTVEKQHVGKKWKRRGITTDSNRRGPQRVVAG
eukprot:scaffold942_cov260-Pinguiococcus_pyrenoidosus.AAC.10